MVFFRIALLSIFDFVHKANFLDIINHFLMLLLRKLRIESSKHLNLFQIHFLILLKQILICLFFCFGKYFRYGPFWIYTTLIFLVAASGNVFKEAYEYKFIPVAASLVCLLKRYIYILDLWIWIHCTSCTRIDNEIFWKQCWNYSSNIFYTKFNIIIKDSLHLWLFLKLLYSNKYYLCYS